MSAEFFRPWLEKARDDLDVARRLEAMREVHPSYACFLAQQAAEKALLAAREMDIPRTHDLVLLLTRLPELGTELIGDASLLTTYAVAPRYPSDPGDYDEETGLEAVAAADHICHQVEIALAG